MSSLESYAQTCIVLKWVYGSQNPICICQMNQSACSPVNVKLTNLYKKILKTFLLENIIKFKKRF
jgi:hypothetical protein